MPLQKPRKPYERKPREVKDGKFASGKKAGRPRVKEDEPVKNMTFTITPSQLEEIRLVARIYFRGSMSALIRQLIDSKLSVLEQELEEEWKKKDAARPHVDAKPKRKKAKPVEEKEGDDLGFVVIK